jgi:phosphoribosylformimino-5-aminoimidazole carboxamide ribotide isomerase
MEIIPAIDIKGGKCVRLTQGDFNRQNLYADNPVIVAKRWKDEGATRLHVVDLDGARLGTPQNSEIVREIVRQVGIPVQLGGGIRSGEIADELLAFGVDRVIFGTAALSDPEIGDVFARLGERAVLGLDAIGGMVAVQGWQQATKIPALQLALDLQSKGAKRIIFTDISRDGMMDGPNVAATLALMNALEIPVIASGGVSKLSDIAALNEIDCEAVVVGKSLYENTVDLAEAIALVTQGKSTAAAGAT